MKLDSPSRMRIGVFCESVPDAGGAFQLSMAAIESLLRHKSTDHEFVVFTSHAKTTQRLHENGIESILIRVSGWRFLDLWSTTQFGGAVLRRLRRLGFRNAGRHLDSILDRNRIDIVMFTEFGELPVLVGDHPIIVTVMDLDHRDFPEFPEKFRDRAIERRERFLPRTLARATAVIVSSQYHATRIAGYYRIDPRRIHVLPFLTPLPARNHFANPQSGAEIRKRYATPKQYVFYPAFFSVHKNHLYLMEALVSLEQRHGIKLDAVFCGGGDPGDQELVERQVAPLGLDGRIHFLGMVPDAHLPALYEGAVAMAMPSYFGPTNLPPLEAITLGCPAICSDLPGCREQMGDAALYCSLNEPASLADHLAELIRNPSLRERQVAAGKRKAREVAATDYYELLKPVFDDFTLMRRRWAWPSSGKG